MRNSDMSKVLDQIRSQVGTENLSTSCKRGKCGVFLEDVPSQRVLVDADLAFPAHKIEGQRCDFVLFFISTCQDTLIMVPMELKGGNVDASEASEQLRQGAVFADRFTPGNFLTSCRPILFHRKRIHPKQRKTLNRAKVLFRGLKLTIKTAYCNQPKNLARALRDDVIKWRGV